MGTVRRKWIMDQGIVNREELQTKCLMLFAKVSKAASIGVRMKDVIMEPIRVLVLLGLLPETRAWTKKLQLGRFWRNLMILLKSNMVMVSVKNKTFWLKIGVMVMITASAMLTWTRSLMLRIFKMRYWAYLKRMQRIPMLRNRMMYLKVISLFPNKKIYRMTPKRRRRKSKNHFRLRIGLELPMVT